jgi:CBS domain-containing protein
MSRPEDRWLRQIRLRHWPGQPIFVDVDADADADVAEVLGLMGLRQVKRLPVVDDGRLVGMISEADLARNLPGDQLGEFVEMLTF